MRRMRSVLSETEARLMMVAKDVYGRVREKTSHSDVAKRGEFVAVAIKIKFRVQLSPLSSPFTASIK